MICHVLPYGVIKNNNSITSLYFTLLYSAVSLKELFSTALMLSRHRLRRLASTVPLTASDSERSHCSAPGAAYSNCTLCSQRGWKMTWMRCERIVSLPTHFPSLRGARNQGRVWHRPLPAHWQKPLLRHRLSTGVTPCIWKWGF